MPPVPMTFREAGKSGFIEETYVPKGTILYVPIRVINTLPEIWGEDADEWVEVETRTLLLSLFQI